MCKSRYKKCMKTKILFEDNAVLVIHKPAGIAVQSARIGQMDVENELRNYLAKNGVSPYIGLIHRLDQPVEGVLVVAKTKEAAAKLNRQLAGGTLNKRYLAVVSMESGQEEMSGDFVDYMVKSGQVASIVSQGTADAKEARLQNLILLKTESAALVDIEIETGRFHQIRCQMAHHGMPLLGDSKYGSSTSASLSQNLGIRNVALCANRMEFKHPFNGKSMQFEVKALNNAFVSF